MTKYQATIAHAVAGLVITLFVTHYIDKHSNSSETDPYPNRPIKVVVPFSPGGGSDTLGRDLKRGIDEANLLPQPFVIINRPGASATIGSRYVKDAKPDGYTLLFLHDAIITAKYSGKVSYGPEEFEPIAATGEIGLVVAVAEDSPFKTLNDLLQKAKAEPNTIVNGVNMGAPSHFAALRLEHAYKGAKFRFTQAGDGTDRVQRMVGGHIQVAAFSTTEYLNFKPQGIRALCYFGPQRHPAIPEIPTATEQGVDAEEVNMQYWWAPKGTPADRIAYMAAVLEKALDTDHVKEAFGRGRIERRFLTGQEFKDHLAMRMQKTSELGQQKSPDIPNIPLVIGIGLALCLLGIAFDSFRSRGNQPTDEEPQLETSPATMSPVVKTLILFVGTMAYVFLMQQHWLPFVWATIGFIFGIGIVLSNKRKQTALPLVETAIIVSFGVHYLLTEVVVTDLP
jgi:putative tricarboxylic transport membrane protein